MKDPVRMAPVVAAAAALALAGCERGENRCLDRVLAVDSASTDSMVLLRNATNCTINGAYRMGVADAQIEMIVDTIVSDCSAWIDSAVERRAQSEQLSDETRIDLSETLLAGLRATAQREVLIARAHRCPAL